jgi:MutL protein
MPTSLVDSDSLLAVDVGTITTRAVLFDVVEGNYRFVAASQSPTTVSAPYKDVREGVRLAIENLQGILGRRFLGADHHLIMPAEEGQGVDLFAATLSACPSIKTVVVGLLGDVSVESVQRLARSTYARVVDTITLNDPRKPHEQIDSILQAQPELFLIAGGTEDGATRSIQRLVETVSLVCQILPEDKRPAVLFAGNQKLTNMVKTSLQTMVSSLTISPNLRPTIESEDLGPAQHALNDLYSRIRATQTLGVDELDNWSSNTLVPTAYAMARIIRFLSQDANTGVLGVDIGAAHTTVAAGFGGSLTLGVYPQLGLGEPISGLLRYTTLEEIMKWLPMDMPADDVRDYLYQKSVYPASLPATAEELAIEQAAARQALYLAYNSAVKDFPSGVRRPASGLPPYFEPILAGGSVITRAPKVEQSLLLLLDAIQPMGITTVILDQNNLLPALGAAAARSPILPVQVFESLAFRYLATVVSPSSEARLGTPVLNARLIYQNGNETRIEVKQGGLEILPLSPGQAGRLYLEPFHHADIGLGPGRTRGNGFPVSGTVMGVVIDARGRPLRLPLEPNRRRDFIKKWLWTLGG